jgi:hypothetical protein
MTKRATRWQIEKQATTWWWSSCQTATTGGARSIGAQFGRFADGYDMTEAKTKAAKIRLIGNSVCPEVAEALVRANVGLAVRKRVA